MDQLTQIQDTQREQTQAEQKQEMIDNFRSMVEDRPDRLRILLVAVMERKEVAPEIRDAVRRMTDATIDAIVDGYRDALGIVARGTLAESLLAADDRSAGDALEERARRVLPDLPPIVCRRLTRFPQGMPHFPPGRFRDLAAGNPAHDTGSGVVIAGDYLAGPGLEGAIRSGFRAAGDLLGG